MVSKPINYTYSEFIIWRQTSFFILRVDWMTTQFDSARLLHRSQDSSVGIATGYRLDGWGSIPGKSSGVFSSPQHSDWL
jgi:hypothetical protein